jgi:hypothetical protein
VIPYYASKDSNSCVRTLPEGWYRDRVHTNEVDRASLCPQDLELISAWINVDLEQSEARLRASVAARIDTVNASRVVAGLPTLKETEQAIAAEMGLANYDPASQRDLLDVVNAMHKMGAEVWGFVVFKTWGYKEGECKRWDLFWSRWKSIMDRG